jgi:ATP-dependent helicase/nuclease subunit A
MIKAPETGATYPSLPLWLAQRQLRLAGIGEEMRVLYVALTRAENILLLFGSATGKQPAKWAEGAGTGTLHPQQLLKTQSWLDWIGVHAARSWPGCFDGEEDLEVPFTVRMHYSAPESGETSAAAAPKLSEVERQALLRRLHFDYPYADSVKEPAKTSVSALRNRMERLDDETAAPPRKLLNLFSAFDGRNRGLASHSFLQHVDLRGEFGPVALQRQAEDLVRRGLLEQEATRLIDWEAVADFWESETGREIRQRWNEVRRELPFTFRLGSTELARLGLKNVLPVPEGEFIVTQGVADLVVLGRGEIWLIDFKTDSVNEDDVKSKAEEYRPQIALYALALEKIFERPVTRRGLYFLSARKLAWLN